MNIEKADLNFDSSLIMIYGEPASGKSSIFEAIAVCLSSMKRSGTYGEYVKQGCKKANIKLNCLYNRSPLNFDITLNRVNGTAFEGTCDYNGHTYKGSTEIESFLEQEDLDYYVKIMFTMQHDKDITELGSAPRLDYIQKLFNFNFDDQKNKINSLIDENEQKLQNLQAEMHAKRIIENSLNDAEELKAIDYSDGDIALFNKELNEKERIIMTASESAAQLSFLRSLLSKKNNEFNSISYEIKINTDKVNEYNKKLELKEKKLQEIKDTNAKMDDFKKKKEEYSLECADKKNSIKDRKEKLEKSFEKEREAKLNFESLNKKEKLIKEGKCPECGRPTKELGSIEDIEKLKSDVSKNLNGCNSEISSLQKEISSLEKEYNDLNLKISNNDANIILNKRRIEDLSSDETLAEVKIDNSLIEKKSALDLEIKKLEAEIEKIPVLDSSIVKRVSELKSLLQNHSEIILFNNGVKQRNKEKAEKLKRLNEDLVLLKETIISLNSDRESYDETYNVFNKLLPQYMSLSICSMLEKKINDFIHNIFPTYYVKLMTSKNGCDLRYTKDMSIQDERKNKYLDSKMSSGFERCVLNTAFKSSLAEVYGLDLFVGDEIDKAANDKDSLKLLTLLLDKPNFNQIFLISHRKTTFDSLKDNYDDYLFYEADNGTFTLDD